MKKNFYFCAILIVALFLSSCNVNAPSENSAVDLGLPSGTKWAKQNIGAKSQEEFGDFYAWGECEKKESYLWSNYKWAEMRGDKPYLTKYVPRGSSVEDIGKVDGKNFLDNEDDVVKRRWGGNWHMPTQDQARELVTYCDIKETLINNVKGYLLTSKINGNSIFLPKTGYQCQDINGNSGYVTDENAIYWLNEVGITYMDGRIISFWSEYGGVSTVDKYMGLPIRAVIDGNINENKKEESQITIDDTYWTGDSDFLSISFRKGGSMNLVFSDSNTKYQWSARNGQWNSYVENNKIKVAYSFEASYYPYGAMSPTWVTFHGTSIVYGSQSDGYTMTIIAEGQLPGNAGMHQFIGSVKKK